MDGRPCRGLCRAWSGGGGPSGRRVAGVAAGVEGRGWWLTSDGSLTAAFFAQFHGD